MSEAVDSDDDRELESRWDRLVEYMEHNGDQIIVDATILLAWLLATTTVFGMLGLPQWLHYLVLFTGIVAYSQVTPSWHRPYESPD